MTRRPNGISRRLLLVTEAVGDPVCEPRSDRFSFGEPAGVLLSLCDAYWYCLAHDYLGLADDTGSALAVLKAFEARTAVIEWDYFDVDFRSEFSATQETSLSAVEVVAYRIHFFSCEDEDPSSMLEFLRRVAKHDEKKRNPGQRHYEGYAVIRPSMYPTVGRAMVRPIAPLEPVDDRAQPSVTMRRPKDLIKHIRTAAVEVVSVFGVPLRVYGVPFMEQDGALLRCSHVAAWMAHFTAVLHGTVARRPTAHFNSAEDPRRSYGRTLPSDGMSDLSQAQILDRFDLPAEIWGFEELVQEREIRWHDRPELALAVGELITKEPETPTSDDAQSAETAGSTPTKSARLVERERQSQQRRLWFSENLTSGAARYLNSGFPVIINARMRANAAVSRQKHPDYRYHSVMVCGYIRERDRVSATPGVDVTAFVAQDDQAGPFRLIDARELADVAFERPGVFSVVVPLPSGLWLNGADAESWAAEVLPVFVYERRRRIRGAYTANFPPAELELMRRQLRELDESMNRSANRNFALRSYAMPSSDFKRDFARRVNDENVAHVAAYANFPKYVWVVEVLDRRLRHPRSTAGSGETGIVKDVLATIVLDGSAVSDDQLTRPPSNLLVHLPGQISLAQDATPSFGHSNWLPTRTGPYESGRWNYRNAGLKRSTEYASRAKSAIAWDNRRR